VHDVPDVFLTTATQGRHWLEVRLVGKQSNRSAIGARLRFVTGDVVQLREVSGGGSYLSQNDLRVHVGLGTSGQVDRLEVRWPNGREEQWPSVKADQAVTLVEGTSPNLLPLSDSCR
jgi:hypothetical protein